MHVIPNFYNFVLIKVLKGHCPLCLCGKSVKVRINDLLSNKQNVLNLQ